MIIEKTILSRVEPKDTTAAWAKPVGENVQLHIFNNGKWRPINGSGSSSSSDSSSESGSGGNSNSSSSNSSEGTVWPVEPDAPMLTAYNFYSIFESKAEELSIDQNTVTEEQMSQLVDSMSSVKFATPKQGNAVLTNVVVEEQYVIFTFQCDDGSYITFNGETFVGLRPDLDGYIIWKTTMDKLPVRGSQEETDPEEPNPGGGNTPKSVKSGSSLKVGSGEGTEEVYTVINNNTGEIVDPLELHKLTNVIWYNSHGMCIPFYSMEIYYGANEEDPLVSTWQCIWGYGQLRQLVAQLQYDYTIIPFDTIYTVDMTVENSNGDFDNIVL